MRKVCADSQPCVTIIFVPGLNAYLTVPGWGQSDLHEADAGEVGRHYHMSAYRPPRLSIRMLYACSSTQVPIDPNSRNRSAIRPRLHQIAFPDCIATLHMLYLPDRYRYSLLTELSSNSTIMDESRTGALAHCPLQYAIEYPVLPDPFDGSLHEPVTSTNARELSEDILSHHTWRPFSAESKTILPGAAGSYLFEEFPYISPSYTSSSTSYGENLLTPNNTGFPVRPRIGSPALEGFCFSACDDSAAARVEPLSKFGQPTLLAWDAHLLSHSRSDPAYEQTPFPPVQNYTGLSEISAPLACLPYSTPAAFAGSEMVPSEPYQQDFACSDDFKHGYSDSESENSKRDADTSFLEYPKRNHRRSRTRTRAMELEKWALRNSIPAALRTKLYECPLKHKQCADSPCPKRFERLEHLRRHVRTVHGDERPHTCKVCSRAFSRGDNLREHYWTHVARDGKVGHNKRMAISQLKTILGPEERRLVRRLRIKLKMRPAKRVKTKS
jgi:hypothetical protein